jgi:hypothetical protein
MITQPTFNGVAIFGRSPTVISIKEPSAEQLNHFFGLHGVERIGGGNVGRITRVTGVLYGSTSVNLLAARLLITSYDDDNAYTLIDTLGQSWPHVVMRQFDPNGRILVDSRGYYIRYTATFRHLI